VHCKFPRENEQRFRRGLSGFNGRLGGFNRRFRSGFNGRLAGFNGTKRKHLPKSHSVTATGGRPICTTMATGLHGTEGPFTVLHGHGVSSDATSVLGSTVFFGRPASAAAKCHLPRCNLPSCAVKFHPSHDRYHSSHIE
jgi:hypothetical protein